MSTRVLRISVAVDLRRIAGRRWMGLVTRNWERKRFYRHVTVEQCDGGFGVKLDHRNLRTPLKELFEVPFEILALIVAQEWAGQVGVVKPSLLHVASMCNTVIDNPQQRSRDKALDSLISYLHTDTLRARSTEPDTLVAMQQEEWDPVMSWFNERFETNVDTYTSLLPPAVPLSMLSTVMRFMKELNRWSFAGFEACVEASKSLIVSCALFEGRLTAQQAATLTRLEVRFQTERWGEVEWQHCLEHADLTARLSAGLIIHTITNKFTV